MRRIEIGLSLAALLLVVAAVPGLASPTVTTIHAFTGADGFEPTASLIQGADGLLYGITIQGGANDHGAFYNIDTGGVSLTDLLSFDNASTPFGMDPESSVVQGTDGNFYGTTLLGGANDDGTVFQYIPATGYNDLYDFGSVTNDAVEPNGLIQGSDGNFYGTTQAGGVKGDGTVFMISSSGGSITVLHLFGAGDLETPMAGLVEGEDGSLYGTTKFGGPDNDGGVFRINLDGSGYAVLHNFTGGATDGANTVAGLVAGGDGFLYGVTTVGGSTGFGTVFKIAPDGTGYQTIYSFSSGTTDVGSPNGTLALGNDGNLYDSGFTGGANDKGGLFEVARNGTADTLLHSFAGADGESPTGGLIQATDGDFFGTAELGTGSEAEGTIFDLDDGLSASPTGVAAQGGDPQVTITWTADTLGTSYNLYRSTTSGGEGSTPYQTDLTGTSFTDTGVADGTPYYYRLASVNAGVVSAKSYEVVGTPQMGIATTNGLSVSPSTVAGGAPTTGTLTLQSATTGPTTAFVSSDNPNVTFASPDVTVPASVSSTTFAINTANTGSAYTADITASDNGTDATTSITVNVPSVLHTFAAGLQMISANTNDSADTLTNMFASSTAKLAVYSPSIGGYKITPSSPADTIVPAQGYWFHPSSSAPLYDIGADTSPTTSYTVSLEPGWNMVGDPQSTAFPVSSLEVQSQSNPAVSFAAANLDGLVADTFYTWQPADTAYEVLPASGASLAAYEGYWLYAFQPCTLIFPAP